MDEGCQRLQSILTTREVEYMRDLEEGREHWRNCLECQEGIPDAIAQLDSMEKDLLRMSSSNIESIYYQYKSDIALAKCRETTFDPDEACVVLAHLAKAGCAIKEELDHHNDHWGLGDFRPSDPLCEYGSRTCAKMIATLPQNVQTFVCESTVAADLSLVFENGFPSDHATKIYNIIKHAAPEFLKTLFSEDVSLPTSAATQNSLGVYERIEQKLDEYCDRSEKDLDNALDSLKACQMEMMRDLTRWFERSAQRQLENYPREETSIPLGSSSAGPSPEPMQLTSTDLGEIRHLLLRILNFLEGPVPNDLEFKEGPGSRVNRLRDAKKIPRMVAQLMRVVLDFRNAVEYNEYKLSAEESGVVRAAWSSIVEWAKQQGWEPPDGETAVGSNAGGPS